MEEEPASAASRPCSTLLVTLSIYEVTVAPHHMFALDTAALPAKRPFKGSIETSTV